MKNALLLAVLLGASYAAVRGQAPATSSPAFEVAAIKQNKSGDDGGRMGGPPSRWTATNVPLRQFILYAYQIQAFQIDGAPGWVATDRWDINAKTDATVTPAPPGTPGPLQLMMRTLLTERFKLAAHHQTKEMPIYELVMAKPDKSLGPQLHKSDMDCAAFAAAARRGAVPFAPPPSATSNSVCAITNFPGRISSGSQPMTILASILSNMLQRVVVDRTGLAGNYDALVTFTPDRLPQAREGGPDLPAADPNSASVFTAIQEQLGLRLESTRGPVDVLVIDHVERPTED